MTQALTTLAGRLGVSPARLGCLAAYADRDVAALDDAVAAAVARDDAAVEAALEDSLRFVPRLLRGAARGLLLPGGQHG